MDVARLYQDVNTNDASRFRLNQFLDTNRINRVRTGVDVTKYRSKAEPLHRVSCSNEGKRRHDYFTAHFQRPDRQLEADCGVANRLAMVSPKVLLELLFKFFHTWAIVGEPASIEHFANSSQEALFVADIRATHMQRLLKTSFTTEDRKIISRSLG